jgi:hypothetical protein
MKLLRLPFRTCADSFVADGTRAVPKALESGLLRAPEMHGSLKQKEATTTLTQRKKASSAND